MRLMDSLFYWLQMKLVCDQRPDDEAARETAALFSQMLTEEHGLAKFEICRMEEEKIYVTYQHKDGTERTVWFDRESAEHLLQHPILSREEKERLEKERGSV